MNPTTLDELTVGELLAGGIEGVDAFCVGCGHMWQAPITFLPPVTTLSKVEALMMCPTCGGRAIEVSLDSAFAGPNLK